MPLVAIHTLYFQDKENGPAASLVMPNGYVVAEFYAAPTESFARAHERIKDFLEKKTEYAIEYNRTQLNEKYATTKKFGGES